MSAKKFEKIRVILRIRPLIKREKDCSDIIEIQDDYSVRVRNPKLTNTYKEFTFNRIYGKEETTKKIYDEFCFALVDATIKGFHSTVLSYGATGSGKTFTMSENCKEDGNGIIQNTFKDLFAMASTEEGILINVSYLQIYNDHVTDLLGVDKKKFLNIRGEEDKVYVEGLSSHKCETVEEISKFFNAGNKVRAIAATKLNDYSSRSHAIFKIEVKRFVNEATYTEGVLNLVDLAGSEKIKNSESEGVRKQETAKINLSMLALGNVISALATRQSYVPYRDSKLTRILQNSLGGHGKTVLIANVSPSSDSYDESIKSLRYAERAAKIKNKPILKEDDKDALIRDLRNEIEKLKDEINSLKTKYGPSKDDESSGSEFINSEDEDIGRKQLSEKKKKKLLKRKMKFKQNQLDQNVQHLNDIDEVTHNKQKKATKDVSLSKQLKQKRAIAKEILAHLNRQTEYNEEDADLITFDKSKLSELNEENAKEMVIKMHNLILKQVNKINSYKEEINDILVASEQDKNVYKKYMDEIAQSDNPEPDRDNKECIIL